MPARTALRDPSRFNRAHRGLRSRGAGISYSAYRRRRRVRTGFSAAVVVLAALFLFMGGAGSARAETGDPGHPGYRLLIVPVVPPDLYNESAGGPDPRSVNEWHATLDSGWFDELGRDLDDYLRRVTYGRVSLEVTALPWQVLPRTRSDYVSNKPLQLKDGLRGVAERLGTGYYDVVAVVDATSPLDPRFQRDWSRSPGLGWFQPGCGARIGCVYTGVVYPVENSTGDSRTLLLKMLGHELGHAVDFATHGRYVLPHGDDRGYGLMGPAYPWLPLLSPEEERALLGTRGTQMAGGEFHLQPREWSPGLWRTLLPTDDRPPGAPPDSVPISPPVADASSATCEEGNYVLEYRLAVLPRLLNEPGVLVWCDARDRMVPLRLLLGPGEYRDESGRGEVTIRITSMGPEGADGTIAVA